MEWMQIVNGDPGCQLFTPGIDDESIYGPAAALSALSALIDERISQATAGGEFRLRQEFARDAEFGLHFIVQHEDFDPASAMPVPSAMPRARPARRGGW